MGSAPLYERVHALSTTLSVSERRAADFMAANPSRVALCSAAEIGRLSFTSDATVIRAVRKLGYPTLRHLRESVLNAGSRWHNPSSVLEDQIEAFTDGEGPDQVFDDTIALLSALRGSIEPAVWRHAVDTIADGRTVFTYGIDTSGILARYLAMTLSRVGVPARAVTSTGLWLADELIPLASGDVVVLFPTLRHFREIDAVIDHAKSVGAKTVIVTETLGTSLRPRVDAVLSTPQSTTTTTNGIAVGLVLVRALELSIIARNDTRSLRSLDELSKLRSAIVGGTLDLG
jgi:DNA-binding MurR/RpiR family transcriptional regulator